MASRIHSLSFVLALLTAFPAMTHAALPHVEQLAPGVFAAGFADRYGSANCGWVTLADHTMLIDLPYGIDIAEFRAEVEKSSGKPPRSFVLTRAHEADSEFLGALQRRGLRKITTADERGPIGDATIRR